MTRPFASSLAGRMAEQFLFLQKTAGRGGAKNRLLDTLAALQAGSDARLHVLCGETGEFTGRLTAMGVPFSVGPLPEWRKLGGRMRFAGAMRVNLRSLPFRHANWVVSNEMWWAPHAGALARSLGARSAVIIRDGIATARKARQYRMHHNDLLLPSSIQIAEGLRVDPELKARTQVFLDSVRLPPPAPQAEARALAARLAGRAGVDRWLLVIGKLGPRKRQADAVRVLRRLLDLGHSGFGLALAGDAEPDYEADMTAAIAECGVADRVLRLGNVANVRPLFDLAEICLLTSLREALPGSVIEALEAGRPCFMYPCEGAEDIFGPHRQDFVSTAFEPAELADRMDRLLRQPEELARLTSRLQARALGLFSPEAHLGEIQRAFGIAVRPPGAA
jgi:glycosyltransferase involved in cell wall biosynthesis